MPSDSYHHIARAMDMGAEAIVVPMVGTAEQARRSSRRSSTTPVGKRGVALQVAHDRYRMRPVDEALAAANARTLFVALIETAEGVENVDAIAAIDGVDCLWVGHFDLSARSAFPGEFDHPDFLRALDRCSRRGRRHGKSLGRLVTDVAAGVELRARASTSSATPATSGCCRPRSGRASTASAPASPRREQGAARG